MELTLYRAALHFTTATTTTTMALRRALNLQTFVRSASTYVYRRASSRARTRARAIAPGRGTSIEGSRAHPRLFARACASVASCERMTDDNACLTFFYTCARRISMSVMREGTRYAVEGKVGETLAKALSRHPALVTAVPVTSIVRGPDAHVLIPDEHLAKMPELEYLERTQLEDVGIDPGANSRLASQCMLTPELDGLVVSIAEMYPENPM